MAASATVPAAEVAAAAALLLPALAPACSSWDRASPQCALFAHDVVELSYALLLPTAAVCLREWLLWVLLLWKKRLQSAPVAVAVGAPKLPCATFLLNAFTSSFSLTSPLLSPQPLHTFSPNPNFQLLTPT